VGAGIYVYSGERLMRRTTRTAFVLALGCLAGGAAEAPAAWNNVFQTTACCGESSRSSYFAPAPAPACCPSVSYVQRTYYQPVTTYKTESYYEPVTTYRTSYYWEPVTRYRYTSYYDPCTGCSQQVATPCTSYYLRSKCNACQSYVQRCRMVPVTSYRASCYYEPVVTYSDPCGNPCPSCGGGAGVAESPGRIPPAAIGDSGTRSPAAGINESSEPPRIKSPGIQESSPRQTIPVKPVRADRIASRSLDGGRLAGQVVRDDRITPRANATLKFVGERDEEVFAKADAAGRFAVELPPGEWTLYLPGTDGKARFHSTLVVRREDDRRVTVVSQ
jgi:hypothetical protein